MNMNVIFILPFICLHELKIFNIYRKMFTIYLSRKKKEKSYNVNLFVFSLSDYRTKVEFIIGGESFDCTGQHIVVKGFTCIMPWLAISEKNLPQFMKGEKLEVSKIELYEVCF